YQLTSANAITHLPDFNITGAAVNFSAPAQSITLIVLPTGAPNTPPIAAASATPSSGIAPLTVNFSSAGSSDPDGSIVGYGWSFGDGSPASNAASPSHIYSNAGNFTAVLTVTDDRGATSTAQVAIAIS